MPSQSHKLTGKQTTYVDHTGQVLSVSAPASSSAGGGPSIATGHGYKEYGTANNTATLRDIAPQVMADLAATARRSHGRESGSSSSHASSQVRPGEFVNHGFDDEPDGAYPGDDEAIEVGTQFAGLDVGGVGGFEPAPVSFGAWLERHQKMRTGSQVPWTSPLELKLKVKVLIKASQKRKIKRGR
jgi:hypothetical protein